MEAVFLKLLDTSVTATWLVLVVLVLRFVLKKAPKWIHCCLWAMVAVRLLCPFSFESVLSLIPDAEPVTERIIVERNISTDSTDAVTYDLPQVEAGSTAKLETQPAGGSVQTAQSRDPTDILAGIWLAGIAVMVTYAFVSYRKLSKRVAPSIALVENLYLCDYIESPFILGILSPKIYLPSDMDPNAAAHVLAHERAHIRRHDHWWKPLGFILLTLHWFNPVMWLAYVLLCRDIELACDEKVIREMGAVDKKSYSEALLSCSVPRHMIAACPLAFGEVGVKERVKSVLNYKKPTFWIILLAVVVCIAVAVCFLTDPVADPFGKTYQVNEVLYRHPAVSFYVVPKDAPIYGLTEDGGLRVLEDKDSGNWLTPGEFERVSLSEDNFDVHLKMSLEADLSPAALREENRRAWVLYVNDLDAAASSVFYYLLMQDNGDVYLAQGTCGGRVEDGGVRSISSIYRLGEETSDDPFASADTPCQWTRNLGTEHVEWMQVTAYNLDGTQRRFTLGWAEQARLVRILNDLSPDDFELSNLSEQNTVSCYIACKDANGWNSTLDVNLRFDGDEVDMSFGSEEGAQRYESANSRTWVIRSDELNAFFSEYVDMPEGEGPYTQEELPFQWTSHVTADDFLVGSASCHAYGNTFTSYHLLDSQLAELAELLNQVREDEIIPGDIVNDKFDLQGNSVYLGIDLEYGIHLSQQGDYVRVYTEEDSGLWEDLTIWHIDNEALEQWMEKLSYGGTYMLTHANRAEVKEQLGASYVEYFDPQEYEDLLFVGCRYDDQSKVALAVFEADENGGYTLLKVTPYEQLGICSGAANIWWDHISSDGGQLTVFMVLNYHVTSVQWTGEFEATVPIVRTPGLVVVEVPENAETECRFMSGHVAADSVGIHNSGLLETIVEYSHSYANMQLPLPGGWEHEIVAYTDDQTPFGIRFRPEGEEGWLYLQYSPGGFAVCGTGLETMDMRVGIEYRASVGTFDGGDIWSFIRFSGLPGDYVLLNEGADGWLSEYEETVMQILNSSALAQGMAGQSVIETLALIHALDTGWTERVEGYDYDLKENYPEITYDTRFSYEQGIWYVTLRKAGNAQLELQLDRGGLVLNEE